MDSICTLMKYIFKHIMVHGASRPNAYHGNDDYSATDPPTESLLACTADLRRSDGFSSFSCE